MMAASSSGDSRLIARYQFEMRMRELSEIEAEDAAVIQDDEEEEEEYAAELAALFATSMPTSSP